MKSVKNCIIGKLLPELSRHLFTPWTDIKDIKNRRRFMLLSGFLLCYSASLLIGSFIVMSRQDSSSFFLLISSLMIFITYIVSRTRYYEASHILSLIITALPVAMHLWANTNLVDPMEAVMWLAFPILVCILFASRWQTVIASGFYIIMITVIVLIKGYPEKLLQSSVPFIIILAGFSIAIINARRNEQEEAEYEAEQRITAQRQMETQEQIFRSLLDSFRAGVLVVDPETGLIMVANSAAVTMLSLNGGKIIGERFEKFVSVSRPKEDTLFGMPPFGMQEGTIISGMYKSNPVAINVSEITDDAFSRVFITITDISEWKKIEDRQKKLEQELITKNQLASLGQMAAGVAHEINNPLAMLMLYTEDLVESELPQVYRDDMKVIHSQVERIMNIVSGMLNFSRPEQSRKADLDINTVLEEALNLRKHELNLHLISVTTSFSQELPHITANPTQLLQVFSNIIVNAEKELIEAPGKGVIEVVTESDGSTITVRISDTGRGIPPEKITRIFDPFYTTRDIGEGTGLGLSICHGILTRMGARIWAENRPEGGTSFIMEFPVPGKA